MSKEIKCEACGSQQFITEPNQYDLYEVIDGKLIMTDTLFIDDEFKLYCRECSEELENSSDIAE